MHFRDFSPPANPTREEQRDALQKGLGRAVQWARAGRLDADLLLEACLHEQRVDPQFESNRGAWLWGILQATGFASELRAPILAAFLDIVETRDAYQLCVLAGQYACAGDRDFLTALESFVERRPFADRYPSLGETQLLEAAGESGLLHIAQVRGRLLTTQPWDWDSEAVMEAAVEILGLDQVTATLVNESDPDVQRFLKAWQAPPRANTEKPELPPPSIEDILAEARVPGRRFFRGRVWAHTAAIDDLRRVAQQLWCETDTMALARLLEIFWGRGLPEFDRRLIDLCNHPHEDVHFAALRALSSHQHPAVRAFALQELANTAACRPITELLIRNFEPGDEERILASVSLPEDACDRHRVFLDVFRLLEDTPESDSSRLGLAAYALTTCSYCRIRAVELLLRDEASPEWLLEECRDDCEEEIRELVTASFTDETPDL